MSRTPINPVEEQHDRLGTLCSVMVLIGVFIGPFYLWLHYWPANTGIGPPTSQEWYAAPANPGTVVFVGVATILSAVYVVKQLCQRQTTTQEVQEDVRRVRQRQQETLRRRQMDAALNAEAAARQAMLDAEGEDSKVDDSMDPLMQEALRAEARFRQQQQVERAVAAARHGNPSSATGLRYRPSAAQATAAAATAAAAAAASAGTRRATAPTTLQESPETSRLLRQQQDLEYEMALQQDQAREAERKAAMEAEMEAERRRVQEAEDRAMTKALARSRLDDEPDESVSDAFLVNVRLPGGNRTSRRFQPSESLEVMVDWLEVQLPEDQSMEQFSLCTSFPSTVVYPLDPDGAGAGAGASGDGASSAGPSVGAEDLVRLTTLEGAGITGRMTLLLRPR